MIITIQVNVMLIVKTMRFIVCEVSSKEGRNGLVNSVRCEKDLDSDKSLVELLGNINQC